MRAPSHPGKEVHMKGRLYRLATTAGLLAILIEGIGAGSKWG